MLHVRVCSSDIVSICVPFGLTEEARHVDQPLLDRHCLDSPARRRGAGVPDGAPLPSATAGPIRMRTIRISAMAW